MPIRGAEIFVTIGLAGAMVAQAVPEVPDAITLMGSAVLGSAVTSGWRIVSGLVTNWLTGLLYWFTGAVGAYMGTDLVFNIWPEIFDPQLHVPVVFFSALFAAAIVKAFATAAKFDGVVTAFQDGLAERVKRMAAGK